MGFWAFVFGISLVSMAAWVLTNWIRAKHGDPWGETDHRGMGVSPRQQIDRLSDENEELKAQVGRLEERLSVLEAIVTDPAERTAREIERLR